MKYDFSRAIMDYRSVLFCISSQSDACRAHGEAPCPSVLAFLSNGPVQVALQHYFAVSVDHSGWCC